MSRDDLAHRGAGMRSITHAQFIEELKAQGVRDGQHTAFVCPMCGTTQSAASLIRAGAGETFEDVQSKVGFSCIGRFTGAGPAKYSKRDGHANPKTPEGGCDWTLGGLFRIHKLEIDLDGKKCPHFELATPAAAQRLQQWHDEHKEVA